MDITPSAEQQGRGNGKENSQQSVSVTLTYFEQNIVIQIGYWRQMQDQKARIIDQRQDKTRSGLFISTNGVAGEMAVAKYFRVYPDLDTKPRRGGYDLDIPGIGRVDVKTSDSQNSFNIKGTKSPEDSDAILFVEGNYQISGQFKLIGWIKSQDALKQQFVKDIGNGPYYSIPKEFLHTMETLP